MRSQSAIQSLLLMPDPRQTPLGERSAAGLQRMAHTPYGQRSTPPEPMSRTGFNGQCCEPQGWYHLGNGHRVYNPVLMRFHTPDMLSPFGKGGLNGYAYCVGDPINYTDPTGQWPNWLQPALTLLLNASLLVGNILLTAVNPAAVFGFSLLAVRMSVVGATVGIAGASTQLAQLNNPEPGIAGRLMSAIGTAMSIGGAVTRVGVQYGKLLEGPRGVWSNVRGGARVVFRGHRAPKQTVTQPSPSASQANSGINRTASSSSNDLTVVPQDHVRSSLPPDNLWRQRIQSVERENQSIKSVKSVERENQSIRSDISDLGDV